MSAANENRPDSREARPAKTQSTIDDFTPDRHAATIIARLEKAGHTVSRLENGYLASRWGLTLHCPDLAALVGFAKQVGALQ